MAKVVDRRLLVLPAVALLVAAVLGYLAGRGHARVLRREQTVTTPVGSALLDLPAHWRRASNAPAIPGLALGHQIALAPDADASHAGLLAGVLPAGQPSPLPRTFVAHMRALPATAVVGLQETQAYRYSGIAISGVTQSLTVYVVPNPGGDPTGLVCYAAPGKEADMQACQRAVATLTLAGQSQSYDLTPQPEYASGLSGLLTTLDARRGALRSQLAGHVSTGRAKQLAEGLAHAFAIAAATLSGLEPAVSAGPAQTALSSAILRARAAYQALANAAAQRDEGRFAAARSEVDEAETGVDAALENFSLLGFKAA
jgi:hypothetical protein